MRERLRNCYQYILGWIAGWTLNRCTRGVLVCIDGTRDGEYTYRILGFNVADPLARQLLYSAHKVMKDQDEIVKKANHIINPEAQHDTDD